MSLTVLHRTTQAIIDITRHPKPRQELPADQLICRMCGDDMFIRHGVIVRPYFTHKRPCSLPYACHPESEEHRQGKVYMRRFLERRPECVGATVEFEVPLHHRKRIADIMVVWPDGHQRAVEIQRASMTTKELKERTDDYFADGIDVIWVLGKTAATSPANRLWCETELTGFWELHFTQQIDHLDVSLNEPDPPSTAVE